MARNVHIGIDPGSNGGIAVQDLDSGVIELLPIKDNERLLWGDIRDLGEELDWERDNYSCTLEWINPGFYGIGKSSASKLYGSYMQLRGFLVAVGIRFSAVKPKEWQAEFGLSRSRGESESQWKGKLKKKAVDLFPGVCVTLAVCDALLISEYGRRRYLEKSKGTGVSRGW